MQLYRFISISETLLSCQKGIMDDLFTYDLLSKFGKDVKKIIIYHFIKTVNIFLKNKDIILWHDHNITEECELLKYFPEDKLNTFIDKLSSKIKKLTRRLIFLKVGSNPKLKPHFNTLDGEIVDEIILLNNQKPENPKKLLEFLHEHNLGELFNSFAVHLQ